MVFYTHIYIRDKLLSLLPKSYAIGTSDKQDREAIHNWNAGTQQYLVAHPAAAGHGLNMQGKDADVVWLEGIFDYELYTQAVARVHRAGVTTPTTVHIIQARDTIDIEMQKSLNAKELRQNRLLKNMEGLS